MNILYDGPFTPTPKGGVVRYFHEISTNLAKKNRVYFTRKCLGETSKVINLPPFPHFRPNRISFSLEFLWFKYFYTSRLDIVHPCEFQLSPTGSYFVKKGTKLVITIHDLIHEKFGAPGNLYSKTSRTNFYNRANGFIFVSKSTRDDFAEFYPDLFRSRPSKVIWHGCNFPIREKKNKILRKQFLFVGSRNGYKNFATAAKAFCKVADEDKDCSLVIAGAPPKLSELRILKNYENRVSWIGFPGEKQLKTLYQESNALLFASEYEGFGMPLLEAMSQGCIPIAGTHSSIQEVLGEAGIKVNCESVGELHEAMKKCLLNDSQTQNSVIKGLDRASFFTWGKTAKLHTEFYTNLR